MVVIKYMKRRSYWYEHPKMYSCNNCFNHKWKQGAKKNRPKTVDYFEYIRSKEWHKRREEYLNKFGRHCQACGNKKGIEVHHKQYGEFGHEPDYALVAMCSLCHKDFHATNRLQNNMIKATELYIKHKQAYIKQLRNTLSIDSK